MVPAISLMLMVEKRLEIQHQDYSWWCHRDGRMPLGSVEKQFETRRQEYVPDWFEPESAEPRSQCERNDLFKRIWHWFRPQPSCGCLDAATR